MISLLLVCNGNDEIADEVVRISLGGGPQPRVQVLRPPIEPTDAFHAIVLVGRASVHIVDAAVASGIPFAWILLPSDVGALASTDRPSLSAAQWILTNAAVVLAPSADDAAEVMQRRDLSPSCRVLSLGGAERDISIATASANIRALVCALVQGVMQTAQPKELSGDVLRVFDSLAVPLAPFEKVQVHDAFPSFVQRVPEPFISTHFDLETEDEAGASSSVPLPRDWYHGLPLGKEGRGLFARLVAQTEAAERFVRDWNLSDLLSGQLAFGECTALALHREPRRDWRLADLRFNEERLG
ncbi:MAG: hypothetical protein ACOY4R_31615 [Pseudomonadota bacterium]